MATTIYSLQNVASQRFLITMDGSEYIMKLNWSDRNSAWFYTISDQNNNILMSGRKLLTGVPLTVELTNVLAAVYLFPRKVGSDVQPTLDTLSQYVLEVMSLGLIQNA